MAKYLVKVGFNYPPNRRAEVGDTITDAPAKSIKWLREQGVIELVDTDVPIVDGLDDADPADDVVSPIPAEKE